MKIFVVTTGEYSEFSIRAMFSTEAKAQAYVTLLERGERHDAASIEEWDLDADERAVITHTVFYDSRVVDAVSGNDGFTDFNITRVEVPSAPQVHVWDDGTVRGTGTGTSPAVARKVLQDAVAKARAEFLGL